MNTDHQRHPEEKGSPCPSLSALPGSVPLVVLFDGGMTRDQIGWFFGVSGEMIRQIEAKAMRKLRHPWNKALREFVEPSGRPDWTRYDRHGWDGNGNRWVYRHKGSP